MQLKLMEQTIRESSPGFEKFSKRQRLANSRMLEDHLARRRQQKGIPDGLSYHCRQLEKRFGLRQEFMQTYFDSFVTRLPAAAWQPLKSPVSWPISTPI